MGAKITSITGLQNLPNLQQFNADFNSLTSVDLSGLTNLELVDISDNEAIDSEEGETSLTSVNLTGCTNITELRLDDSNFSANGGNSIIGLSDLTSCTFLDLDQCGIEGTLDLSALTSLEVLDVSGNDITDLIISDTFAPITDLSAGDNALTQNSVNNIFINLDGSGVTNGEVSVIGGTSAAPSGSGLDAAISLDGKGWSIFTNNAPGLTQRNNWYDATDTGSVCAHTAGFNTFYASGSLGIGTQAYTYNWGGIPTADGWYQPTDDIDFTLYYVTGGVITATGSCP
jgi:hypothetical protein